MSGKRFGLLLTAVLGVAGGWPLLRGGAPHTWLLVASAVALTISLAAERCLEPPARVWARVGAGIAWMVNQVILVGLFYGVVTPVGLVMRLSGRDALRLRQDPRTESYWIERDPAGPEPDALRRQF